MLHPTAHHFAVLALVIGACQPSAGPEDDSLPSSEVEAFEENDEIEASEPSAAAAPEAGEEGRAGAEEVEEEWNRMAVEGPADNVEVPLTVVEPRLLVGGESDRPSNEPDETPAVTSVLRPIGNTNISLGGAQDFGLFRRRIEDGQVPVADEFDAAGFFAEHHTPLPTPDCGEVVCLQAMLGVMADLTNGEPVTILQLGLNSPIEADPGQRPPLTLAVVIDVSGSMQSAGKIDFVRDGLELLIDRMHDDDQIAIVTYANNAETAFPMASVSENRVALRELARGLRATGGTNLYDGLQLGYRQVIANYDSGRQNRVIILSDGQPTEGITAPGQIQEMSSAFNSEGVGLTTIGLGSSFNVALMRGLAEQGDGNFYFVEDSGAVEEVFSDEISYFTVPVAFDLDITVEMGSMYELVRAHGSTQWEPAANGGHFHQPSVFLAHRVSHADVTDSGGRRGGGSALILELRPRQSSGDAAAVPQADIATVSLSFREPGTNRDVTGTVTMTYPNAPWIIPSTGYFQAPDISIIQKSFLMFNMYTAIETAATVFHSGQTSDAVAIIKRIIAAAEDFNDAMNDTDIRLDIELLEQFVEVMVQNGAEVPIALEVAADPWPCDQDG